MPLKYIFHISDIHIRNGDLNTSRYKEYSDVFHNLHQQIEADINYHKLQPSDFLIIITGDIFHNKNVIGNYGLALYKQLLHSLTSLGKTIIFHGNHDKCQNDINQPSLVASALNIPNLTILTHSQSFIIDNIGFSYVSIDDTLNTYKTSGRIENLPPFPTIESPVKYKIALFHGTFSNVRLYNASNTSKLHHPYPFEWIQDFDYALLGDIHLQQAGTYKNTLWGYSGSLLQQNFGEDIINHGYMLWDLENRDILVVDVYNPYGFINIKESADIFLINHKNNYIPLLPFIEENIALFPSTVEIKLHSEANSINLISLLKKYNINATIINNKTKPTQTSKIPINTQDIIIDSNKLLEYFDKALPDQQYTTIANIIKNNDALLFNHTEYPLELHGECHKKNKELQTLIQTTIQSSDKQHTVSPFFIQYLEWKNLYCYQDKNWIDFNSTKNSTFLISGNNGIGKSAIYDILTLAIWGDITPNKQNTLSKGIINSAHDKGYTIVDIKQNSTIYRIQRKFNHIKDKNLMNKSHICLYKYNKTDKQFTLVKMDNGCNQDITSLFGTMEDFIAASMVTQNMDLDIISMNYKDCIAYIDKATNIDYIYNLYNLFKGSINKYKDFRKTIENKKQVYERILSSSKHLDEESINTLNSLLSSLQEKKQLLVEEINTILIDINDPDNKSILETDYEPLIDSININITEEEYKQLLETYNELKISLKNIHVHSYANKYNKHIQTTFNNISPLDKPCDYAFIAAEESALHKYQHLKTNVKLSDLTLELDSLKAEQLSLQKIIKDLHEARPPTSSPKMSNQSLINHVSKMFSCVDKLIEYCNSTNRMCADIQDIPIITYDEYMSYVSQIDTLTNTITSAKVSVSNIDKQINDLYTKQQGITYKSSSKLQPFHNSKDLEAELTDLKCKTDFNHILTTIEYDEFVLKSYFEAHDNIHIHEKDLAKYKQELDLLNTQEDYQYNPRCKFCCKRPWVQRMKELNIIISSLQKQINKLYDKLYDDTTIDYLALYIRVQENKESLTSYQELKELHDAALFNETTECINTHLKEKEDINSCIIASESTLEQLKNSINTFNARAFELYDAYNDIQIYKAYSEWKHKYDKYDKKLQDNYAQMAYLSNQITYIPRLENLVRLKKTYEEWQTYDDMKTIVNSYKLLDIQSQITAYEKFQKYKHDNSLKPLIARKLELSEAIRDIDIKLTDITNQIASHNTSAEYYTSNVKNHDMLSSSLQSVDNTISTMTIIIDKFKLFRKELYETVILKNLVSKTNALLSSMCHHDTKQFQLDFMLSEMKDIIHINWLIKSTTDNAIISIHQASGFQRFAISLALRMALFNNMQHEQLFIDEGFTACDKLNLSVVPAFLKSLLQWFNSIIIVSHIDIIQDSVENKAEIAYNNITNTSRIMYGKNT